MSIMFISYCWQGNHPVHQMLQDCLFTLVSRWQNTCPGHRHGNLLKAIIPSSVQGVEKKSWDCSKRQRKNWSDNMKDWTVMSMKDITQAETGPHESTSTSSALTSLWRRKSQGAERVSTLCPSSEGLLQLTWNLNTWLGLQVPKRVITSGRRDV